MTIYPQRRTSGEDDMSEGVPTMSISLHDVEKLQALYPDHQIELREGKTYSRTLSRLGNCGCKSLATCV